MVLRNWTLKMKWIFQSTLKRQKNLIFKKNENGDFIIPDKSNFKLIHQKQRVVRGYIGTVYSDYIHLFI